jgi:hypothetical protein
MSETYEVNGVEVETYDKQVFSEYRSKWTRKEEQTEVDVVNHIVPQYSKHFPDPGEYPDEVYEETGCIPHEEVLDELVIGDEVLFWTGPPCNENSYLMTGIVRDLPPVKYHRIGKESIISEDHITTGAGNRKQMSKSTDGLMGEIQSDVRIDCIVAINPEKA